MTSTPTESTFELATIQRHADRRRPHRGRRSAHRPLVGQPQRPFGRNGMALCRLCHWTFDEGLLGVSARYAVLLGRQLAQSPNVAGHLLTLEGRSIIIGPVEQALWPDLDALAWHRREVLQSRYYLPETRFL
jgi:hypothetical protein